MNEFFDLEKEDLVINCIKDIVNFAKILKRIKLTKSEFLLFKQDYLKTTTKHYNYCLESLIQKCYSVDDHYFYEIIKKLLKNPFEKKCPTQNIKKQQKEIANESDWSSKNSGSKHESQEFWIGDNNLDDDAIVIPLHSCKDSFAHCIGFNTEGNLLCAGFENGNILCWEIKDFRNITKYKLKTMMKMRSAVLRLNFVRPDVIICAQDSKEVCYINIETKTYLKRIKFDTNYDMHCCLRTFRTNHTDVSIIIGGSYPLLFTSFQTIRFWPVYDKLNIFMVADKKGYEKELRKIDENKALNIDTDIEIPTKYVVTDLCLSLNGSLLFVTTIRPERILVYSMVTKKLKCDEEIHDQTGDDYGTTIAFDEKQNLLFVGQKQGHVTIYRYKTFYEKNHYSILEEILQFGYLFKGLINDINIKSDEKVAIFSSEDGSIRFISYKDHEEEQKIDKNYNIIIGAHDNWIYNTDSISVKTGQYLLATCSIDQHINVFSFK